MRHTATCAAAIAQPWLGPQRLRSASAVLVNIEGRSDELSLKRYVEISRFVSAQCDDNVMHLATTTSLDTPEKPFQVTILVSGIHEEWRSRDSEAVK